MSDKKALLEMILLLFIFTTAALLISDHNRKVKDKLVSFIVCTFKIYCFMCIGRLILLKTGEFYAYSQDIRLLVSDIVMGVGSLALFCRRDDEDKYAKLAYISITVIGIFVYKLVEYKNINSAIYHSILPEAMAVIGLIVLAADMVGSRLIKKMKGRSGGRHMDSLIAVVAFAFSFTIFIYPFLETFLSNTSEFSFTVKDIIVYLALFFVLVYFAAFSLLNNLPKEVKENAALVIFAVTIAAYVQELFLNRKLSMMDGVEREWSLEIKAGNLLVWCLIFAAVCMIKHFSKSNWKGIVRFCCIAIVIMQASGFFSIVITKAGHFETKKEAEYFSTKGLYEVAQDENVIVFVLDKYDEKFMEDVLENSPDFLEPLTGFTYYPDTVAQFSRTYPAVTYMLTDTAFFQTPEGENYCDYAFDSCSFWKDLAQQDFCAYFYEDDASYIGGTVKQQADNYIVHGNIIEKDISLAGCIRSIHTMSCYKIMPYVLKDCFMYTEDTINNLVLSNVVWEEEQYKMDDAKIKADLDCMGLVKNSDKKAFRFIHMFGAHPPYSLDRYGNRVEASKDLNIEQYMGSMQIVYNYIDELKKLGLYENSTIIITADHGDNFESEDVLPEKVNVIMFVKPKGKSSEPLAYSNAYASQSDLLPTLAGEVGISFDRGGGYKSAFR